MFEAVARRFRSVKPAVDFCSLRIVKERKEMLSVRQHVLQPAEEHIDQGGMVTVLHRGGLGYAATSDLSQAGLEAAIERAKTWAELCADRAVFDFRKVPVSHAKGTYESPVQQPWDDVALSDKIDLVMSESQAVPQDERLVDWETSLMFLEVETLYLTTDGGHIQQRLHHLSPGLAVVANKGGDTQLRSLGMRGFSQQGGWEVLERVGYQGTAVRLAAEAIQLLEAPQCPSGPMHLLLDSDQMMLQIHESIGHPLELDRILGDERNYAGTSFVTLDMFGEYQYGSALLDVTFDPTIPEQFASYGFDDDGTPASREYVIREGKLLKPLGGVASQARAGIDGVANSRASTWSRPPIDRMANLNVEAGDSRFEDLVKQVERGVFMRTNKSWSIDDSRNKFQFGCEWGRLIQDGELGPVVRNPNYRGISATFWRSLVGVGDRSTVEVLGTPYCGKGEPNQVIRVGHASPSCLFENIDVFGGA